MFVRVETIIRRRKLSQRSRAEYLKQGRRSRQNKSEECTWHGGIQVHSGLPSALDRARVHFSGPSALETAGIGAGMMRGSAGGDGHGADHRELATELPVVTELANAGGAGAEWYRQSCHGPRSVRTATQCTVVDLRCRFWLLTTGSRISTITPGYHYCRGSLTGFCNCVRVGIRPSDLLFITTSVGTRQP